MKQLFLFLVFWAFATIIIQTNHNHPNTEMQTPIIEYINPITGKPFSAARSATLLDIPAYYREAAIYGKWNLLNPPSNMAMQAYIDQKKK
jgi:hypothetical protein